MDIPGRILAVKKSLSDSIFDAATKMLLFILLKVNIKFLLFFPDGKKAVNIRVCLILLR